MDKTAQISVVATVLNEATAIGDLITGLARQQFRDFEIVIVDGGSTDGTWERLKELAAKEARLRAIHDESCNLRGSPGPIAKGRNRAIREAGGAIIACADAGCQYDQDWLAKLIAPIVGGKAEYALGGSYIDASQATVWDVAAAPFLGVKLDPEGVRKSCTARSMAMRKTLWERVGGFPEEHLFGEDTVFDLRARQLAAPAFVAGAMARYMPRFTLRSAVARLGLYANSDGVLGVRRSRFVRNLLRCIAQVAAVVTLAWTWIPLAAVGLLEIYFAFEHDVRSVFTRRIVALVPARLLFAVVAPWVIASNYVRGAISHVNRPNSQNLR